MARNARAEDIARAFHEAMTRIEADHPDATGKPIAWEHIAQHTRDAAIGAVRELLADGIIALPAPHGTVNVERSIVSEADLLKAVRRGMDGRGKQR